MKLYNRFNRYFLIITLYAGSCTIFPAHADVGEEDPTQYLAKVADEAVTQGVKRSSEPVDEATVEAFDLEQARSEAKEEIDTLKLLLMANCESGVEEEAFFGEDVAKFCDQYITEKEGSRQDRVVLYFELLQDPAFAKNQDLLAGCLKNNNELTAGDSSLTELAQKWGYSEQVINVIKAQAKDTGVAE